MNRPITIIEALQSDRADDDDVFCHFLQSNQDTVIRYGDLRREARRYANLFHSAGVQPGEVTLIILRHSPDLLYSFLGAMLAGAIPSFMPPATNKQDSGIYWNSHQKLFARIGSGALLTHHDNLDAIRTNVPEHGLRVLAVEAASQTETDFRGIPATSAGIAFLQHSSGTTGLKKGVALSHAAVITQVENYARALALNDRDQIVSWLPLYHDMGLIACFMLPLITRTPVVMLDPFEWVMNPALLFDAIKLYRGTLCWQPNFAFHHLCRTVRPSARLDLSSMRAWIDCSEPCRAETFDLFSTRFATAGVNAHQLQVCYAMAETVFAVTQTLPGHPPRVLKLNPDGVRSSGRVEFVSTDSPHQTALSAGKPIPGLQVHIVNERGEPLPDRHTGEIAITGDCLFSGYHKLAEETRLKFRHGWYYTGDLGFIHEGELYVTGRKHDLIIVHGRNYYAHELEFIVNQTPGVHPGRNLAVGWFRPEVGSEDVVVISECPDSGEPETTKLVNDIKHALLTQTGLQVYDVHLVPPGWLIKTTSGKISRVENLNKYLAELSRPQAQLV